MFELAAPRAPRAATKAFLESEDDQQKAIPPDELTGLPTPTYEIYGLERADCRDFLGQAIHAFLRPSARGQHIEVRPAGQPKPHARVDGE